MRLSELEKIAFDKEAAGSWSSSVDRAADGGAWLAKKLVNAASEVAGKGLRGTGKVVNAVGEGALNTGKYIGKGVAAPVVVAKKGLYDPVVKPVVKGTGKVVGRGIISPAIKKSLQGISNTIAEDPLGFGVKAVTSAAVAPAIYGMTSYKNYANKVRNPVKLRPHGEFGNRGYMFLKEGSMDRPLREIEKIASLEKTANIFQSMGEVGGKALRGMGFGTKAFWPTLAVLGGSVGAGATILGPTLRTTGEQLQKGVYPASKRINKEDELAKMRLSTLDKFDIDKELKAKEKAYKTKTIYPQAMEVLTTLKSKDPILSDAAKDKKLNSIMGQTMDTVYSFAPDVSKDPRAMQSVLTEAVTSPDGGLSFQTIKGLADTQKAITQGKGKGTK